jgi:hypothetical protein
MVKKTTYFALGVAIALSTVAAYFSVLGLMEIFSSAPQAVMIMAIVLEVTKVTTAYWAHINWMILPKSLKLYLVMAVVTLMGITSLGIYGFLAKAHITQKAEIATKYDSVVKTYQVQISSKNDLIKSIDQQIGVIDGAVKSASDKGYVTKSLQLNKKYAEDKQKLIDQKSEIQRDILGLEEKIIQVESDKQISETKIGPIKYIVNLIYGDASTAQMNAAVRWLIIVLVAVFDPLAIFLLIGTGYILRHLENPIYRKPVAVNKPKPIVIKKAGTDDTTRENL